MIVKLKIDKVDNYEEVTTMNYCQSLSKSVLVRLTQFLEFETQLINSLRY